MLACAVNSASAAPGLAQKLDCRLFRQRGRDQALADQFRPDRQPARTHGVTVATITLPVGPGLFPIAQVRDLTVPRAHQVPNAHGGAFAVVYQNAVGSQEHRRLVQEHNGGPRPLVNL